jgi:hypothetical protein
MVRRSWSSAEVDRLSKAADSALIRLTGLMDCRDGWADPLTGSSELEL